MVRWRFLKPALAVVAAATLASLVWVAPQGVEKSGYGALSLLPAATALLLAFLTREVLSSLLLGIVAGGLVSGKLNILQELMLPALATPQYALILLVYLWCLGGLIGLWTRTGGAQAFAGWAAQTLVRGPRSAKFFAWLMGIVFHQGGTISTVLAGTTVRPVADRERVSHEELSYVVDSTASPVAGLIPLNVWPVYAAGLVAGTIPLIPDAASGVTFFYRSIPFNFYAIFAVSITLLFSLELLPWYGTRMRRAMERARTTGRLNAPDSSPLASVELSEMQVPEGYRPSPVDFLLPISTLIGFALGSYILWGTVLIAEAFGSALLVAAVLALARGLRMAKVVEGIIEGCKGVTAGAILLGLAVTLGRVSEELGTARFIVEASSGWVLPALLPALLLAVCMAVAFSIGTSFGTFAVIFPLAMPLAWSVSQDPTYVSLCFASVVGGSMFGDQCSPISDTTILSSLACGADVMDHVTTQLPLAVVAAGLASAAATLAAWWIL